MAHDRRWVGIGFATSWPAKVWLINRGIKEAM
jgi:hypothetical protein